MAEDLFITALAYFSASLVVSLLAGRFISLQDENIRYDAVEPKHAHLGEEGGPAEMLRDPRPEPEPEIPDPPPM